MADFVQKSFGLGAKNNVLRVLRKIEGFMLKFLYPNITGCVGIADESYKKSNTATSGAFIVQTKGDPKKVYGNIYSDTAGNWTNMGFPYLNAASQNYIFSAETVCPPSFQTLFIVRI